MHAANIHDDKALTVIDSLGDLQSSLIELHLASDAEAQQISVAALTTQLMCVHDSATVNGLTGIANVTLALVERVSVQCYKTGDETAVSAELAAHLEQWVQLIFDYLNEPDQVQYGQALVSFLDDSYWHSSVNEQQHAFLMQSLITDTSAGLVNQPDNHLINSVDMGAITLTPEQVLLYIDDALALPASTQADTLLANEIDNEIAGEVDSDAVTQVAPLLQAVEATTAMSGIVVVSPAVTELITMVRDELHGCMEALHQTLEAVATAALANEARSLEDYRWQVERLANAAESLGLSGLHGFFAHIVNATCMVEHASAAEVLQACAVLDNWPELVSKYLEQVGQSATDTASSQALFDYLTATDFTPPLDEQAARDMLEQLCAPDLSIAAGPAIIRATTATAEMLSLQVADDINRDLLDSLLQELPNQTQELSSIIQKIAAGNGGHDDVNLAQRIAHTLKGSANTVGIRGIAELAHHLEDILVALLEHNTLPPARLMRALVDAADCMEAMSESLLGMNAAPVEAVAVLQGILDWANYIDSNGIVSDGSDALEDSDKLITREVASEAEQPAESETPVTKSEPASSATLLRVATTQVDDLLRLSGESKIIGSQLKEGLRRVESQLLGVRRQNQMLQQLVNELEHLVDIRGIAAPVLRSSSSSDFDALEMDQYGELHTVSRRLAEVALDSRQWSAAAQTEVDSLEDLLIGQARQHNESQSAILKMRMVPAATIVSRLQRGVRQTCRLLDKQVELAIKGADTLVDSDSLNQLIDPMMHLLRNAIDHGIESAEQRMSKGKPPQGQLTIEFGREGNQIVVRCKDDGKGLDYQAIQATAQARGLVTAVAMLTDVQLSRLIFQSGFSTRSEVTQTSGRGIGLDVVHDRVLQLKGTLDVHSEPHASCEFVIRLPATLLSAHALLVSNGKHTVAIASRGIRQIVDAGVIRLSTMGQRLSAQIGDEIYEAHQLETLLGQTLERREAEHAPQPALLVEVSPDRICAVMVQAVVDTVDLVIKPLGQYVPPSVGVVGATILGDGSVAPVMDIPELLRDATHGATHGFRQTITDISNVHVIKQDSKAGVPTVLVVDDSLSVRRAMEQLLRDAGYEVTLARDGLEAVAMLQTKQPDIMLVDMEMPRMNGIELTTHARNRPETRDLPIIMITSRSTDKHRKQADVAGVSSYMSKPYAEDRLLEQIATLIAQTA